MGDFSVKPDELGAMAAKLKGLAEEFKDADKIAREHGAGIQPGSVRDKLHEFATNWSDEKGKLVEELEKLAGQTKQAANAYHADDVGISQQIQSMSGQVDTEVTTEENKISKSAGHPK